MIFYRYFLGSLLICLVILQIDLWRGSVSLPAVWKMGATIDLHALDNRRLVEDNQRLTNDIAALRNKGQAIEARARLDLGMIRPGETFFYLP